MGQLFDRVSRITRANLNSINHISNNPEEALAEVIKEMEISMMQLREALSEAIAAQKRLEQQYNEAESQATEWQNRSMLALQKGDEDLAREALSRQQTYTQTATALKHQLEQSEVFIANQKKALMALEAV